jgi:UDP:flavonoid glycosyltransferase YjiC (YdhE family)
VRVLYTNVESRDFSSLAERCGISATAVGGDYFASRREELAARAAASFERADPLQQVRAILEDLMDPVATRMVDAGRALARESDVFVSHFLGYPAHVAAEAGDCPHVLLGLVPLLPSAHYGPIGVPSIRPLHKVAWWIANRVFESIFGPRVHALRAHAGLPEIRRVVDPEITRARAILLALSPALFPRPPDLHERAHVTGFLSLPDEAERWTPEPALEAFLADGEAPAFLSFGSMMNLDPARAERAVSTFVEAARLAESRAVIQAPEAVLTRAPRAAHIHYLSRAPHVHLFPRCSVVVHHGGAGTTQSALLAGKPSVVVPHAADQFYWGDVLLRAGAAPKSIHVTKLDAAILAKRLREARRPELAASARRIGERLRTEDGAERAAELVERVVP